MRSFTPSHAGRSLLTSGAQGMYREVGRDFTPTSLTSGRTVTNATEHARMEDNRAMKNSALLLILIG
jgi:hypothetical protein